MTKSSDTEDKKPKQIPQGALDSYYIAEYLDKPENKSEAYKSAWEGYLDDHPEHAYLLPDMSHARQYANVLHERLSEQISIELIKLAEEDKALGRRVLRKLAEEAQSESVQAQCATTLSKGLFPDVQITKDMTLEETELALKQLEKEEETLRRPH